MLRLLCCGFVFLLCSCSLYQVEKVGEGGGKGEGRSFSGNSHNTAYLACLARYKGKGYIYLEEKCKCHSDMFIRTDLNSNQKYKACAHLNVKEGEQIVKPLPICEDLVNLSNILPGVFVQQYREFSSGQWLEGVPKKDSGLIWKVISVNEEGVQMELVKGKYFSLQVGGRTRFSNSPYFSKYYPGQPKYKQVELSYKVCINPQL